MRTEAGHGTLAVKLFHDGVQRALQIGHGDAFVNNHALHLVEHGGVGGVHLVFAVNAAGGNDADGQLHGFHGAHLHGAGLRAQHHPAVLVEIKGVGPVAGGVAFLGVELVKIIGGQLYFRPIQNGEAHADENVLDFVQCNVHGMLVADFMRLAGNGNVHGFGLHACFQCGRLQLFPGGFQCSFQCSAHFVGQLAHGRALFGGEPSHLLEHSGQFAFFAQILYPQCL